MIVHRIRRRPIAVAIVATLSLHFGVLGVAALSKPKVTAPTTHIANVLVGHLDPDHGDFVAEGYARAWVRNTP
jgi:hypothetical protein